ncbi:hypothetical protein PHLGIDRAFT_128979 [Phlebiopsis gigantea 11061_1 CR5-6]|uniref:Uncharacterized protein n=1 Tax=Phlebiopsis gigantea (strain 11061_1 CR5-6) TaxID=745531 RepID=A0A0C3RVJ2_PHLG1|nr:hypothetical protein PHLGIDRAFT_128979 [Phlebiopsis gigantea 11061_1 CR5-6]
MSELSGEQPTLREAQEDLISLPVKAWAHGTRVYENQPFWLVTDGVFFKVQREVHITKSGHSPPVLKINTSGAPRVNRRLNRDGYFTQGSMGPTGSFVFKFDVENTVWANGETYEKLSDLLTRELIGRRLVSMNGEQSAACWESVREHVKSNTITHGAFHDESISTATHRSAGPSACKASSPDSRPSTGVERTASVGGPAQTNNNPSMPPITANDIMTVMTQLTEKSRLYDTAEAARAQAVLEITHLQEKIAAMENELLRSRQEGNAQLTSHKLERENDHLPKDFENKLAEAEERATEAAEMLKDVVAARAEQTQALRSSIEQTDKAMALLAKEQDKIAGQQRSIQHLEAVALERERRVDELTAKISALEERNLRLDETNLAQRTELAALSARYAKVLAENEMFAEENFGLRRSTCSRNAGGGDNGAVVARRRISSSSISDPEGSVKKRRLD